VSVLKTLQIKITVTVTRSYSKTNYSYYYKIVNYNYYICDITKNSISALLLAGTGTFIVWKVGNREDGNNIWKLKL